MSDSHTLNVRQDLAAPLSRRLTTLARFVYQKLHDVIVGALALVLSTVVMFYIVMPESSQGEPLSMIGMLAVFGFAFVFWMVLDNIFHGAMGFEFMIAGSIVLMLALLIGFGFAIVGVPFWMVIAFCAALALGAWILFIPAIGLFGLFEFLDDQADEHYLKSRRQAVAAAGRFVVTEFQGTSDDGDDPYFGDDDPQYVVEDTQRGEYYELPSEIAAYRLVDDILKRERAAARQPKVSQPAA